MPAVFTEAPILFQSDARRVLCGLPSRAEIERGHAEEGERMKRQKYSKHACQASLFLKDLFFRVLGLVPRPHSELYDEHSCSQSAGLIVLIPMREKV